MSRTKEFDPDQAVDAAIGVFLQKGYEAASIQDLVDATGVNRASLYGTFGGKRELFQRALERFQKNAEEALAKETAGIDSGVGRIRKVFDYVIRESIRDPRGCLVTNATVELSSCDSDVGDLGKAARELFEKYFRSCLALAQKQGEIGAGRELNIPSLARFLTNNMFGLRMIAKTQPSRAALHDIVVTTLQAIERA